MNDMETKLGRLTLQNPIAVASGTFSYLYNDFYDIGQLGAMITKTITPEPKAGNPAPRLYETKAGLLNSIGLQNPGLVSFIRDELPHYESFTNPLLVSISAGTISEFEMMIRKLETYPRINGYEINVSCPNVENEGLAFGTDAQIVYQLTSALSKLTQKELMIKLSPNVTDISAIARSAQDGGATSLSLINTVFGMAIDYRTGRSFIKKGIAGYSGVGIKPIAVACVYKVAQCVQIPILAMGGVYSFTDVVEFIYAGASVVAVGTGQFSQPTLPIDIIRDLERFFIEKKISIADIKGKVVL